MDGGWWWWWTDFINWSQDLLRLRTTFLSKKINNRKRNVLISLSEVCNVVCSFPIVRQSYEDKKKPKLWSNFDDVSSSHDELQCLISAVFLTIVPLEIVSYCHKFQMRTINHSVSLVNKFSSPRPFYFIDWANPIFCRHKCEVCLGWGVNHTLNASMWWGDPSGWEEGGREGGRREGRRVNTYHI